MGSLEADDFATFFGAVYQNRHGDPLSPMSWQSELAAAACQGDWPGYICVPTGAGKTSAIDIAVFALAAQAHLPADRRTAAMRTYLVVDRRTVVSEAFFRASCLQTALAEADDGILKTVADRLRSYSASSDDMTKAMPLSVVQMRGGIYRDRNWCSSLNQPMIVTSTVDQVGSRLLFRGYGVAPLARSMQAAAVAYDSLIILDEAHISAAFSQTLGYVRGYQQPPWTQETLPRPLRVVEMTATPPDDTNAQKLEIQEKELADSKTHVGNIVNTKKRTQLFVAEKVKGAKAPMQLGAVLHEQAMQSLDCAASESEAKDANSLSLVVGIMCNTVATAKATFNKLLKDKRVSEDSVHLIIGAMRPIDRDDQTLQLRSLISTGADRTAIDKPLFIVSTQCIEVGADYDFDVLISEAAPLDALIQRFGRLNRAGRQIESQGMIVMREDYIKPDSQLVADDKAFKTIDPIYGNAVSATWNWLTSIAKPMDDTAKSEVDFGIRAMRRLSDQIDPDRRTRLASTTVDAPVLLPAHLDLLCQTSQAPWPDPDVSLWLHGPQRNDPEVQVCWRSDLLPPGTIVRKSREAISFSLDAWTDEEQHGSLIQALSLCPPSSAECLSVPLRRVRAWLTAVAKGRRTEADLSGDVAGIVEDVDDRSQIIPVPFRPIAWRGVDNSQVIDDVGDLRPGDTLVLTPLAEGWDDLGYLPQFAGFHLHDETEQLLADRLKQTRASDSTPVACDLDDFRKVSKIDRGSDAFTRSRRRPILRLHPNLVFDQPECSQLFSDLNKQGLDFQWTKAQCISFIDELDDALTDGFADSNEREIVIARYADRHGFVVTGPMQVLDHAVVLNGEDATDDYSSIISGSPIELSDHLQRVHTETKRTATRLSLDSLAKTLAKAAGVHDWGKADYRFQALLLGEDVYTSIWNESIYAKSAKMPASLHERVAAQKKSQLPKGFRHEMLTLALAELHDEVTEDVEDVDLLLHLIASHHGHARPWAPTVVDNEPTDVSLDRIDLPGISITQQQRANCIYHRVGSSVPRRFWKLTTRYGWWGLGWLETILRISDQRVSRLESSVQARSLAETRRT